MTLVYESVTWEEGGTITAAHMRAFYLALQQAQAPCGKCDHDAVVLRNAKKDTGE